MFAQLSILAATAALAARLILLLEGADSEARSRAIDSLAEVGRTTVAPLEAGLRTAGWRGREGILEALSRVGEPALETLMTTARSHPRADARRLAVRSIGQIGSQGAIDSLLLLLDGPERDLAAQGLGESGDLRAAPAIRGLLSDPLPAVRRRAVVALGSLLGPAAVEPVMAMMTDDDHGVRGAAAGVLAVLGPDVWTSAASRLERLPPASQVLAARALGRTGDAGAIAVIQPLLASDDWAVRAAAASCLLRMGEASPHDALGQALAQETHPLARSLMRTTFEQVHDR